MSVSDQARSRGVLVRLAVLTLVAAVALAGCGSAEQSTTATDAATPAAAAESPESPSAPPSSAPASVPDTLDFTGTTVAGDAFDGASLAGKPAVLWFWAPWCPTCRGQIPMIGALHKEYADRVSFVGVGGLDDSTEAIAEFAGDVGGLTHLSDPEGTVWQHFGITAQSTFVVLDADGAVVDQGALDEATLTDLVRDLAG